MMHFVTCNNKSDLQTHSMSLVFVPFDRPYMISYYSSIVTMYVSCTVYEVLIGHLLRDDIINPVKMSIRPSICPSIRPSICPQCSRKPNSGIC